MEYCKCPLTGMGYSCFTGNCSSCGLPRTSNLRTINTIREEDKQIKLYTEEEVKFLTEKVAVEMMKYAIICINNSIDPDSRSKFEETFEKYKNKL